ncbi:hypothetical protein HGRIS_000290 [Hohenbuehelia grisea]|uniref:Uncharacterized protein n=1 Tax=Hohenbuehelia grisea TaxID=104357 RepID=A0ABR3JSL3_9AGAR
MPIDNPPNATTSEWYAVRPWAPRLSLAVREITSVSATFVLSSSFSEDDHAEQDLFLESIGIPREEEVEEESAGEDESSTGGAAKKRGVISDALAKGLSVNVNQAVWPKVFIRIDDKVDEAIIIVHGLQPGRQYDIDLGLVHDGQNSNIRQQVITDVTLSSSVEEIQSVDPPQSEPAASPGSSVSGSPPETHTLSSSSFTLEDRLAQLQSELAELNAEQETLTTSLKSARRDAQKADAALRAEIEALKRTSEKNVVAEHRAKQKVLALQEAVKRAHNATREIEALVVEVEEVLPGLKKQSKAKEVEYARVKDRAEKAQKEKDKQKQKVQKRIEARKGEISTLNNKLEKLGGKREKLEKTVILDLEQQLREIELEIERVEAAPRAYLVAHDTVEDSTAEGYGNLADRHPDNFSGHRRRTHHTSPGTIGRPQGSPYNHRANQNGANHHHNLQWNGKQNLHHHYNHPGAPFHVNHHQTPSRHHTHQPHTVKSPHMRQTSHPHTNVSSASVTTSPPARANTIQTASTSTLSSLAPPFEPGRGLRNFATLQSNPIPIQRPGRPGETAYMGRANTLPS